MISDYGQNRSGFARVVYGKTQIIMGCSQEIAKKTGDV